MSVLIQGEHYYRMDPVPRGLCVIINNKEFKKDKSTGLPLQTREGTDKDRDALKAVFEEILFEVRLLENLTDKQMLKIMNQVADEDHSEYDCFVCCILTYGVPGGLLLGVNGHPVKIRSLAMAVKNQHCASLEGKPKVFFIQACSRDIVGNTYGDCGIPSSIEDTDIPETSEGGSVDKDVKLLPNETDFMLSYCTKPGFQHPRAKENGSLYIQKLVKLIRKYGYGYDIQDILKKLNADMNEKRGVGEGDRWATSPKQEVAITMSTLRMKLRLAPSPKVENLRLLIIGKSKRGKSSVANTIIGKELFPINSSFRQNLFTVWNKVTQDGRTIEITEMPTELDSDEAARPLITSTPGPHVIILCFRCDKFFTPDDYFSYSSMKDWLGNHITKYVILAFSGLDNTTGKGIEDMMRNTYISILQELPSSERLICLNNKADRDSRNKQGERLLRLVDRVVQENSGGHFSNRKIREFEEEVTYQQSHGKSRDDLKRRVVAGEEIRLIFHKYCCTVM